MKWLPIIPLLVFSSTAFGQTGGSPPSGYNVHAVISACTPSHGCSQQHWFLRNRRWCGKTEDGWSPVQGTGKLSVSC